MKVIIEAVAISIGHNKGERHGLDYCWLCLKSWPCQPVLANACDALTAENERLRAELARVRDGNGLLVELEAVDAERQALQRRLTDALVALRAFTDAYEGTYIGAPKDVPTKGLGRWYCNDSGPNPTYSQIWEIPAADYSKLEALEDSLDAILTDPDNTKLLEGTGSGEA